MSKQTRQRFLSIGLTLLVPAIAIIQNVSVTVSANNVSAKKAVSSAASSPQDETTRKRQASLADALNLNTSELIPQRTDNHAGPLHILPPFFSGYIVTPDDHIICGGPGLRNSGSPDDICYLPLGGGQNPIRRWMPQANGIRMIFGY